MIPNGYPSTVAVAVLAQLCDPKSNEKEMDAAVFPENGDGRNFDCDLTLFARIGFACVFLCAVRDPSLVAFRDCPCQMAPCQNPATIVRPFGGVAKTMTFNWHPGVVQELLHSLYIVAVAFVVLELIPSFHHHCSLALPFNERDLYWALFSSQGHSVGRVRSPSTTKTNYL